MNRRKFLGLSLLAAAISPALLTKTNASEIATDTQTANTIKLDKPSGVTNFENMFKDCHRPEVIPHTEPTPRSWMEWADSMTNENPNSKMTFNFIKENYPNLNIKS